MARSYFVDTDMLKRYVQNRADLFGGDQVYLDQFSDRVWIGCYPISRRDFVLDGNKELRELIRQINWFRYGGGPIWS